MMTDKHAKDAIASGLMTYRGHDEPWCHCDCHGTHARRLNAFEAFASMSAAEVMNLWGDSRLVLDTKALDEAVDDMTRAQICDEMTTDKKCLHAHRHRCLEARKRYGIEDFESLLLVRRFDGMREPRYLGITKWSMAIATRL